MYPRVLCLGSLWRDIWGALLFLPPAPPSSDEGQEDDDDGGGGDKGDGVQGDVRRHEGDESGGGRGHEKREERERAGRGRKEGGGQTGGEKVGIRTFINICKYAIVCIYPHEHETVGIRVCLNLLFFDLDQAEAGLRARQSVVQIQR